MISIRAANRGWGHNLAPRVGEYARRERAAGEPLADTTADVLDGPEPITDERRDDAPGPIGDRPDGHATGESSDGGGGSAQIDNGSGGSGRGIWRMHPIGWLASAVLLVALAYNTVFETKYLIGNLQNWQWVALLAIVGLSLWPVGLNGLRIGIDSIASVTKRISMFLAWVVFIVQLFNVVTRYGTRYVEQDILIGQATSLAWMSFAALFLLGANYGIRDGVNPRIDFWWANFTDKKKAWIDFTLHALLFLPFVFMAIRILQPYAAISLGRKRDGSWPSGYRVWETWEQSSDADQLPVGPIKALLLVGFVLIGIQLISELIKTGFVIAGRRDYGNLPSSDAPQRIE